MVVELKRVNIDLSQNHLKQATRYAIDIGCEWVLLTNGRQWELYHVEFGQPPEIRLIKAWNLLQDEIADLAESFELISFRSIKKGVLNSLWEKQSALTLAGFALLKSCRRIPYGCSRTLSGKKRAFKLHPEDIVAAIRKLLNDQAGALMDDMGIPLPERKQGPRREKAE